MNDENTKDEPLTNAEKLAKLQAELAAEDEVEEEHEHHFKSRSVIPPKDRSTTGI